MKFKAAIQSMRLRTLPLSIAGVLLGILLAVADWKVDPCNALLSALMIPVHELWLFGARTSPFRPSVHEKTLPGAR
jgi:hypothetical protein